MKYVALITKDLNSDYGVEFPDVPGCITAGSTIKEAIAMASEALIGHLELLRGIGQTLPPPSKLEDVIFDPIHENKAVILVHAPSRHNVRVNVVFEEEVLQIIDHKAKKLHLSRSAFLAKSAMSFNS